MSIDTYALTSREAVHAYRIANGERLNTTPETNTLIDNLINAVSARFESYCDRKFKSREYTEYHDGGGHSVLYPDQYPITSISGIYDDSNWSWAESSKIDSTQYRIVGDNSIVFKSTANVMGDYRQNIKLIYTAGYSTLPYDLENACILEIMRAMGRLEDLEVSEKRSNENLLKYVASDFLPETRSVIEKYRRKVAF